MSKKAVIEEMVIGGTVYVPKGSESKTEVNTDGLECVMIRTYSAGVHYGYLKSKEYTLAGTIVTLIDSRRVYYWFGASTLSQLSVDGTTDPSKCKFPCKVGVIELNAIEIIPMTEKAVKSLNSVSVWEQK